jgi:hypothetical protein
MDLKSLIMELSGEDKMIEKSQLELVRDEQELLASRMLKCIESKDAMGLANYLASFCKACEMEEHIKEKDEDYSSSGE